jgi:hypothetical protein
MWLSDAKADVFVLLRIALLRCMSEVQSSNAGSMPLGHLDETDSIPFCVSAALCIRAVVIHGQVPRLSHPVYKY